MDRPASFSGKQKPPTAALVAVALALAAMSPALAQSDDAQSAGAAPRAHQGTAYQHPHRQPTETDLRAAGGKPAPSTSKKQVDEEVKQLLQQTDRLDKQSEQQNRAGEGSSQPR